MPYLPAKDELVSLNRLSSRGIWKWYGSKVFDLRLYGVEQHFTFCRFSRKRKLFGNFDCDFRKSFTKGFFCDGIWRILKFSFWRQILDIYRQPLLNFLITPYIYYTCSKYVCQVCMQTCMPREGVCIINVWGYTEILPFVLSCFANTLNYGISSVCGPHFHWKLFSKTALLHCTTQTGTQSLQVSSFVGGSSHDVTAAILVFQNNKAAAILVFQTNPVGVEHFSYVKNFFYFNKFA